MTPRARTPAGRRGPPSPLLAALVLGLLAVACGRPASPPSDDPKSEDPRLYFFESPIEPFFTKERAADGSASYVTRRVGSTERPNFPARKGARVKRIFLIGGSVVQLFDEDRLEELLRRALPAYRFEIIDCGMSGFDSVRDLLTVEEVLDYDPDLIVVMSGVNEAGAVAAGGWGSAARLFLRGLFKGHPVRGARIAYSSLPRGSLPGDLERVFSRNLRKMTRAARLRGVPIVLGALPHNFRDMPPRGHIPWADPGFLDAWIAYGAGDHSKAARLFARYVDALPPSPAAPTRRAFGNYYHAKALDREGDFEGARGLYLRSMDTQAPPMTRLNEAVRRVGREEGARVADLERVFIEAAPHGLVGWRFFEDDVHWDRFRDPMIAAGVLEALRGGDGPPPLAPREAWDWTWFDKNKSALLKPPMDERRGRDKAWVVFTHRAWDPDSFRSGLIVDRLAALLDVIYRVHPELLGESDRMKGWLREKLARNTWTRRAARDLDAWWPVLLAHVGEVYLRRREAGQALRFYDEAISLGAAGAQIRVRRAAALGRLGRTQEALTALDALAPFRAEHPEIGLYRTRIREDAFAVPGRSPAKRPRAVGAARLTREGEEALAEPGAEAMKLVRDHLERGRPARALGLVESLIDRIPMDEAATEWLNLAEAVAAAKRSSTALTALERASSAEPSARQRLHAAKLYVRLEKPALARRILPRPGSSPDLRTLRARDWLDLADITGDETLSVEALTRASKLDPGPELRMEIARAFAKRGRDEESLAAVRALPPAGTRRIPVERWVELARTAGSAGLRDAAMERASAAAAGEKDREAVAWARLDFARKEPPPAAAEALLKAARASPRTSTKLAVVDEALRRGLEETALRILASIPASKSAAAGAARWLALAASSRQRPLKAEALSRAAGAGPDGTQRLEIARLYCGMGDSASAAAVIEAADFGENAPKTREWLELAHVSSTESLAFTALKRALPSATGGEKVEIARTYAERNRPKRGWEIAAPLLDKPDGLGPARMIDLAFIARSASQPEAAGKALELAAAGDTAFDDKLRLAVLWQELGENAKALNVWDGLSASRPEDPRVWGGRGVVKALLNDREGAAADLRKALELDPKRPETALTLGGLLSSMGKKDEAAEVYDRALAAKEDSPDSPVWRTLREERDRIRPAKE